MQEEADNECFLSCMHRQYLSLLERHHYCLRHRCRLSADVLPVYGAQRPGQRAVDHALRHACHWPSGKPPDPLLFQQRTVCRPSLCTGGLFRRELLAAGCRTGAGTRSLADASSAFSVFIRRASGCRGTGRRLHHSHGPLQCRFREYLPEHDHRHIPGPADLSLCRCSHGCLRKTGLAFRQFLCHGSPDAPGDARCADLLFPPSRR